MRQNQGPQFQSTPKPPETLTHNETELLLSYLLGSGKHKDDMPKVIRNWTIALFMLDAGLRVGEVTQLTTDALIINDRPVQSLRLRADMTKTHKERIVPLTLRLQRALESMNKNWWSQLTLQRTNIAFYATNPTTPLTCRQIQRIIKDASMAAFGRPIHPHVLRHTFGTNLMRVTDIKTVSELMGHTKMSSTQIYLHPNAEDKRKAIQNLDTQ